ncbi:DNA polymerase III subunit chi [Pseudomonas sp. SWI6]|uniref:DNA polymerase III subunit chi n=1 Tax=Pseudomonas taiwanensis TaxID=470150 RepID=A0ABR6V4K2_9PSED|nr:MULTISPECIES: DNA polymerase III subunit chi [Pseudomonas]AGZ36827.1 DNA polymerase III subunit chi [Pseudomonas sp. VLB120]AVD85466.1 DNA polymerase III subunit chi [Pseudomonas sp. SWI6]AVD90841.1 DNA polymerase III subunit chi [Pseudomonas sp. SWI44]MBC3475440.1 DNA polymerase III subunit chi [Pseudomonas taiwanensis]MBC3491070.1 DNA polymerase III subunit chi [Pseudomonas taiwanensis]
MSKVDFYILPTDALSARLDFACKLCEKAWRLGHRVYLHCQDAEQRDELDLRLWRFKGEAFVPHDRAEAHADAQVALGLADDAGDHRDLLINLGASVPGFVDQFERVAEIVVEEPGIRQSARERFRFYRERGYALQDHRLQRL